MTSFVPLRAAGDPAPVRMPVKLRTVPTAKTSYQPPVCSTGTVMSP